MPHSPFRLHRELPAVLLILSLLAGCPAGALPGAVGAKRTVVATHQEAVAPDTGMPEAPDVSTAPVPVAAPAANPAINTVAPIGDLVLEKGFIKGRIFVPAGIVSNNGANVIGNNGASVIGNNGASVIGNNGASVIGNNGASVIGNNGASVIGNNGASVIGNNGASVIGNNGASVIGNNGASIRFNQYRVANAEVRVVDAAGTPLKDSSGKEIVVRSDEKGEYVLPVTSVPANSVIKVSSPLLNGDLSAFASGGSGDEGRILDVDVTSTLSIQFILERFVKGDQTILNKLTGGIEQEARQALVRVLGEEQVQAVKAVDVATALSLVGGEMVKDPGVAEVFDRIERLLVVVGYVNEGDGLPSSKYEFGVLNGMDWDNEDKILFSSQRHALWRVGVDNVVRTIVGSGKWGYNDDTVSTEIGVHSGVVVRNGTIYLCDTYANRVVQVRNGMVSVLAGNGRKGESLQDGLGVDSPLSLPTGLVALSDGTLIFADSGNNCILKLDLAGKIHRIAGGGSQVDAQNSISGVECKLRNPQGLDMFDSQNVLICDHDSNRIRILNVESEIISDYKNGLSVPYPVSIKHSGDADYVLSFEGADLYEIKSGILTSLKKNWTTPLSDLAISVLWPTFFGIKNGVVFIPGTSDYLFSLSVSNGKVSIVAGNSHSGLAESKTLQGAVKMAISQDGIVAIAEAAAKKIYFYTSLTGLVHKVGNGQVGFQMRSTTPTLMPMEAPTDLRWMSSGELLFSVGGTRPCLKVLKVDGTVETLAGTGNLNYTESPVGKASEVDLPNIREVIPVADEGIILAASISGVYSVLDKEGNIYPFEGVSIGDRPRFISKLNDGFIYFDILSGDIIKFASGKRTVLVGKSDIEKYFPVNLIYGIRIFGSEIYIIGMGSDSVKSPSFILKTELDEIDLNIFAGIGGRFLAVPGKSTTLYAARDVAFAPNGDLYILELDQLKRIPAESLH